MGGGKVGGTNCVRQFEHAARSCVQKVGGINFAGTRWVAPTVRTPTVRTNRGLRRVASECQQKRTDKRVGGTNLDPQWR